MPEDLYYELAQQGPYEAAFGSALITMVEPHVGHEHAYNRWYEDDHFISGAMTHPWTYAGRRWVAPVPYQDVRYPADSAIAQPIDAGKYISVYCITDGQHDAQVRWAMGTNLRALADDRVFHERTHVFTSFQRYRGPIYRDASGPRDIHALQYPYGGLVVEVIDGDRERVVEWLHAERTPAAGSPVAMGTIFEPLPFPDDKKDYVKDVEGLDTRLTVLWFTEGDALDAWGEFADAGERMAATGLGRVELLAPFTPTFPGSDRYVDELRP